MVTHFSGMIPLTHGYTLLWYDTINTYVTHFSGMIPLTHGYTLLCVIPLTHMLHTSLVMVIPLTHGYTPEKCVTVLMYTREVCNICVNGIISEKCVTYVLMISYQTQVCNHVLMVSYQRSV